MSSCKWLPCNALMLPEVLPLSLWNQYLIFLQELAKNFGFYDMDWRELGVPRRGGVIVESFDSDELLQMAPLQRAHAARSIATQLVESIQRASSRSQTKHTGN
ncbi:hypothetical protein GOP47_0016362 [Adiantum capillus-veneris]|uniref:Uncharacterized protein n=1 Tax=Adiantum capillus-veneris TaxID=13818 RepID=A0A9D4ZBN9_ADICA|nr:hypothetical protein GOP47_0016362 [Adiantum capillus-veneris]